MLLCGSVFVGGCFVYIRKTGSNQANTPPQGIRRKLGNPERRRLAGGETMKRWMIAFMALYVLEATAADWTPLQVSLCPPAQLVRAQTPIYGLRLNLLVGYNAEVAGLDLGIASFADDVTAVQVGLMNGARRFAGIQVGLANFAGGCSGIGEIHFPPVSSVTDTDLSVRLRGIQIGLFNDSGNKGPMSLPNEESIPPIRVTTRRESEQRVVPTQRRYDYSGIQFGVANFADRIRGVQIGTLVNEADEVHGLQIAIFKNYARVLHGVQIGLINIAGNGLILPMIDQGLPIINAAF